MSLFNQPLHQSITNGEEEEEEEEEGEAVSGGNRDLYGYHHRPPPALHLSTDCTSRPAAPAAAAQRPFIPSLHAPVLTKRFLP
ncbi:hypothetical protein CRENBAI_005660 [Crenichthys baileyi]|uniref:Uncharacterized protein n=1 Tax=Crenichthys baileyi TaxID=28760 RepID=A0AAV9R5D3_9TELE